MEKWKNKTPYDGGLPLFLVDEQALARRGRVRAAVTLAACRCGSLARRCVAEALPETSPVATYAALLPSSSNAPSVPTVASLAQTSGGWRAPLPDDEDADEASFIEGACDHADAAAALASSLKACARAQRDDASAWLRPRSTTDEGAAADDDDDACDDDACDACCDDDDTLAEWYAARARELDARAGAVANAEQLCALACERIAPHAALRFAAFSRYNIYIPSRRILAFFLFFFFFFSLSFACGVKKMKKTHTRRRRSLQRVRRECWHLARLALDGAPGTATTTLADWERLPRRVKVAAALAGAADASPAQIRARFGPLVSGRFALPGRRAASRP